MFFKKLYFLTTYFYFILLFNIKLFKKIILCDFFYFLYWDTYRFFGFSFFFSILTFSGLHNVFFGLFFMNLFRFHNSYHRFNRLTQIDLIFFSIAFSKWFFFRYHLSTLSLLEIRPCDFLELFFMRLYQSHDSNYGFVRLTQVDFSYFLWSFLNRVSYFFFIYMRLSLSHYPDCAFDMMTRVDSIYFLIYF